MKRLFCFAWYLIMSLSWIMVGAFLTSFLEIKHTVPEYKIWFMLFWAIFFTLRFLGSYDKIEEQ